MDGFKDGSSFLRAVLGHASEELKTHENSQMDDPIAACCWQCGIPETYVRSVPETHTSREKIIVLLNNTKNTRKIVVKPTTKKLKKKKWTNQESKMVVISCKEEDRKKIESVYLIPLSRYSEALQSYKLM